ncbi:putative inorganic phosphate cotransporter isoform X2 [Leptinotarsa decemlineata]|uniref:putative inorganic phosphate cotransporter isoform X2 n=1 Tax=Leptinotarsa decemlineata TaxID=7539 RepID=UPI003D309DD3
MPSKNQTYPEWSKKKNLMLSSFFWGYICLQVIAGQLAKNYGPKRFMSASAFIGSVFCMLIPIFGAYLGYSGVIVCRIITGLSQGFIFPCVHNLLSAWTPIQDRAKIGSFTYAGGPLGTVISLPIAGLISDSSFGWPVVFYVYGALGMLWSVVYFFLGSNSPSQHKSISAEERKYIEHGVPNENMEKVPTPWKSILTSLPFWAILVAHCGQNLGFWTLLTEIPSYMKNILHFEISSNSTLSSLPYLAMWIFSLFMSPVADYLIVKSLTDVRASRKIFNSIGLFVPALTLISLTFVEQSHYILAVVLLTCGVGFNSAVYSGYNVNHIDLSPIHAGTLMGITNTVSNVFSLISPLVVDVVIFFSGFEETDKSLWTIIFGITSTVYFVCGIFYIVFASGEVQPWNNKEESKQQDVELPKCGDE